MKLKSAKIIIATTNKGKLREFESALSASTGVAFTAIDEAVTEPFDVEETGSTFVENAKLKARAGAKLTGEYCLADDSGIEVMALEGRPGIYSGRYLKGEDLDAEAREQNRLRHEKLVEEFLQTNQSTNLAIGVYRLLDEMQGIEDRRCRFVCSLVLSDPEGNIVFETEQYWNGELSSEPKGVNGFGYDPIVKPISLPDAEQLGMTVAELDSEIKQSLSHRAQAINQLKSFLS